MSTIAPKRKPVNQRPAVRQSIHQRAVRSRDNALKKCRRLQENAAKLVQAVESLKLYPVQDPKVIERVTKLRRRLGV